MDDNAEKKFGNEKKNGQKLTAKKYWLCGRMMINVR
jgi:hypothetical protein